MLYISHTSFWHFPIFIFSGRNKRSLCIFCRRLEQQTSIWRMYPLLLPLSWFCMNFWVNQYFFSHLKSSTGNYGDVVLIDCWHASTGGIMMLYSNYSLLCICYWLLYGMTYSTPAAFFIISNISIWLLLSLNMPSTLIQMLKGNEQDLIHKFQAISFWNFQIQVQAKSINLYYRLRNWLRFCNPKFSQTLLTSF